MAIAAWAISLQLVPHAAERAKTMGALVVSLSFACVTSACSSTPAAPGSNGPYVHLGSNVAVLIQWIDNGGTLTGSAEQVTIPTGSSSTEPTTHSFKLNGRIDGSKISISFNNQADVLGTISNDEFTLQFPSSGGNLSPFTFRSGTISQFNKAVSHLHILAAAEAAASNVSSDVSALKNADTSSSILQDMTSIISSITSEDAPSPYACETAADYMVNNLGPIANNLGAARQSFMMDVSKITTAQTGKTADVSNLKADVQIYIAKEKLLGSPPPNAPDLGGIGQVVSTAQADAANLISQANQRIDQANAAATQVYQQIEGLIQAGGCNIVPTAPTPIPHMS